MSSALKISVVTVCYNSVRFIEETILSVLNQTYDNVEYIIIDGGSTDGTVDIIKKYADHLAYWISEPDKGMYDALRKGFEKSTGDILCWINADDFYYKAAFSTVCDFFERNPEVKWIEGYNVNYNSKSQVVSVKIPIAVSNRLLRRGLYQSKYHMPFIQQESTFWRRELMETVDLNVFGNFKLAGDYYLWFSFAKVSKLHFISSYLGGWRRIEGQLSSNMAVYQKEICTFVQNKSIFDLIRCFIAKIFYSTLNGSSIYRKIYKSTFHYWSITQNRFV